MMNFEEQVKTIMQESAADIQIQVKEQLKKQVIDSLTWSLREEVSKIVKETIAKDMQAEIKALVLESQPLVMEELRNSMAKIVAGIGNSLVDTATNNLSQSWKVKQVVDALLR